MFKRTPVTVPFNLLSPCVKKKNLSFECGRAGDLKVNQNIFTMLSYACSIKYKSYCVQCNLFKETQGSTFYLRNKHTFFLAYHNVKTELTTIGPVYISMDLEPVILTSCGFHPMMEAGRVPSNSDCSCVLSHLEGVLRAGEGLLRVENSHFWFSAIRTEHSTSHAWRVGCQDLWIWFSTGSDTSRDSGKGTLVDTKARLYIKSTILNWY